MQHSTTLSTWDAILVMFLSKFSLSSSKFLYSNPSIGVFLFANPFIKWCISAPSSSSRFRSRSRTHLLRFVEKSCCLEASGNFWRMSKPKATSAKSSWCDFFGFSRVGSWPDSLGMHHGWPIHIQLNVFKTLLQPSEEEIEPKLFSLVSKCIQSMDVCSSSLFWNSPVLLFQSKWTGTHRLHKPVDQIAQFLGKLGICWV